MLNAIGNEFNEYRDNNRTIAYRMYQHRLQEHCGLLSYILSPKELMDMVIKLEDYISKDNTADDKTAVEEVHDFLNKAADAN